MSKVKYLNILVVDDEPFILTLTVKVLNKLGYKNIITASDGKIALDLLNASEKPIDIVICDLNMPHMDGVEFIRHANESHYEGALILFSGEDPRILETSLDLARTRGLIVLGTISKPLDQDKLNKLLKEYQIQEKRVSRTELDSLNEAELMKSIQGKQNIEELILYYQPKISIKSGEIIGVEALSRWYHKEKGILGPLAFIPQVEKLNLIDELTRSIYKKAVKETASWNKQGINIKNSINVSINTFNSPDFPKFVIDFAKENGVPVTQLILEVTESQIMENSTDCLEVMMRLRLNKFNLSIDDFGTGNSSLTQLKNIPFSELKIDQSFVHGAAQNNSQRAILETSILLAKKLNMSTVAEGVEDRKDWDIVESLGADIVQGFYCAKPMPSDEFIQFYKNWIGPHNN